MKAINKKQKGFTLIELMIVVAIIGVLSTIAIPAYQDYVKKSEAASALATMKSLLTPAELYVQENGDFLKANEADILKAVGISADSHKLGSISVPSDNSFVFTFGDASAVSKDTTITYSRNPDTGWTCLVTKGAGIETTSCPEAAS
ncbi:prepilin-type N-terminal cleavage/methylation domain-containing protein [Vibrio kyushuensis]|uniref:pilin n=1 Tax=Vibrio kyushuensis TaxID=2910249 RepID=UPI003D0BCD93